MIPWALAIVVKAEQIESISKSRVIVVRNRIRSLQELALTHLLVDRTVAQTLLASTEGVALRGRPRFETDSRSNGLGFGERN